MEVLIALVIVAAVAAFVSVPLRRARGTDDDTTLETELADLEARKQAKYREIRDTELDHASGKIADEEFERQDSELRAEAISILKQIDAATKTAPRAAGGEESPGVSRPAPSETADP